jgi:Fe-S oxidoreductase
MKRCRSKGLCCGAGGAQMFKEEERGEKEAVDTGAAVIAAACPFCNTMLSDGVKTTAKEGQVAVMDIAEILAKSID